MLGIFFFLCKSANSLPIIYKNRNAFIDIFNQSLDPLAYLEASKLSEDIPSLPNAHLNSSKFYSILPNRMLSQTTLASFRSLVDKFSLLELKESRVVEIFKDIYTKGYTYLMTDDEYISIYRDLILFHLDFIYSQKVFQEELNEKKIGHLILTFQSWKKRILSTSFSNINKQGKLILLKEGRVLSILFDPFEYVDISKLEYLNEEGYIEQTLSLSDISICIYSKYIFHFREYLLNSDAKKLFISFFKEDMVQIPSVLLIHKKMYTQILPLFFNQDYHFETFPSAIVSKADGIKIVSLKFLQEREYFQLTPILKILSLTLNNNVSIISVLSSKSTPDIEVERFVKGLVDFIAFEGIESCRIEIKYIEDLKIPQLQKKKEHFKEIKDLLKREIESGNAFFKKSLDSIYNELSFNNMEYSLKLTILDGDDLEENIKSLYSVNGEEIIFTGKKILGKDRVEFLIDSTPLKVWLFTIPRLLPYAQLFRSDIWFFYSDKNAMSFLHLEKLRKIPIAPRVNLGGDLSSKKYLFPKFEMLCLKEDKEILTGYKEGEKLEGSEADKSGAEEMHGINRRLIKGSSRYFDSYLPNIEVNIYTVKERSVVPLKPYTLVPDERAAYIFSTYSVSSKVDIPKNATGKVKIRFNGNSNENEDEVVISVNKRVLIVNKIGKLVNRQIEIDEDLAKIEEITIEILPNIHIQGNTFRISKYPKEFTLKKDLTISLPSYALFQEKDAYIKLDSLFFQIPIRQREEISIERILDKLVVLSVECEACFIENINGSLLKLNGKLNNFKDKFMQEQTEGKESRESRERTENRESKESKESRESKKSVNIFEGIAKDKNKEKERGYKKENHKWRIFEIEDLKNAKNLIVFKDGFKSVLSFPLKENPISSFRAEELVDINLDRFENIQLDEIIELKKMVKIDNTNANPDISINCSNINDSSINFSNINGSIPFIFHGKSVKVFDVIVSMSDMKSVFMQDEMDFLADKILDIEIKEVVREFNLKGIEKVFARVEEYVIINENDENGKKMKDEDSKGVSKGEEKVFGSFIQMDEEEYFPNKHELNVNIKDREAYIFELKKVYIKRNLPFLISMIQHKGVNLNESLFCCASEKISKRDRLIESELKAILNRIESIQTEQRHWKNFFSVLGTLTLFFPLGVNTLLNALVNISEIGLTNSGTLGFNYGQFNFGLKVDDYVLKGFNFSMMNFGFGIDDEKFKVSYIFPYIKLEMCESNAGYFKIGNFNINFNDIIFSYKNISVGIKDWSPYFAVGYERNSFSAKLEICKKAGLDLRYLMKSRFIQRDDSSISIRFGLENESFKSLFSSSFSTPRLVYTSSLNKSFDFKFERNTFSFTNLSNLLNIVLEELALRVLESREERKFKRELDRINRINYESGDICHEKILEKVDSTLSRRIGFNGRRYSISAERVIDLVNIASLTFPKVLDKGSFFKMNNIEQSYSYSFKKRENLKKKRQLFLESVEESKVRKNENTSLAEFSWIFECKFISNGC